MKVEGTVQARLATVKITIKAAIPPWIGNPLAPAIDAFFLLSFFYDSKPNGEAGIG